MVHGTTSDTDNEITEKYKEILRSNGINDAISEVIIKDAGLKGEGFASLTYYVTVKFENLEKKPLNLFVKAQTENPAHRSLIEKVKAFEKEATILVEYVKAANEMCNSKGRSGFIDFYPKCYYGDGNMIVLENLVLDEGYTLKNKEERQDLESAKFAIKTLAKHHAISHVMIQENGGAAKFFQRFPDLDLDTFSMQFVQDMMDRTFHNAINSNVKILEKNDVPGAKEAAATLKNFIGKPIGIMLDALKTDNEKSFLVLCHGDYWNNNMMFLLDKQTGKIVHHKAIDLQVTRYNSPALDLAYYFFSSVKPHVRQAHLREMLELYKDTLNDVTEDFGHPANLTYEEIFMEYRKRVGFGFWFGFSIAVGPGIGLMKDVDVSKIDLRDWGDIMDGLLNKWIDENPDKGVETSEELVELVREYDELRI